MSRRRLTFKTISPELRDTSKWPEVDLSSMAFDDLARFERLMPAVESYLRNGKLRAAAKTAQMSEDALLDQVNRCLMPHSDGGIVGWAGLIHRLRLSGYARTSPLPQGLNASRRGASGAFHLFLDENLTIKKALDEAIRKGTGRGKAKAAFTPHKAIWKKFVELVESFIPPDHYPRNQKSFARRSVERYVTNMIANDAKARSLAVGQVAKTSGQVGNGLSSFELIRSPLDLVGADAHHVDCFGMIEIEGPAGPQLVPISRVWIYVVVDFESRAVCGYAASFRTEPTATQIELALDMATKPWQPRVLNMGAVRYKEGAGFPMGCVDGFVFAPAALRMDSAAQSFANRIVHRVRRRFGCAVSWSAVGAWYHNDVVERFFGSLERFGLHRLPTSVGSGPADPRRTDGAAAAVKLNVTWQHLLDLLEVAIAEYNAKAQPGLGHRSPLEVLRDYFDRHRQRFVPRPRIPPTLLTPRLGVEIETHTVRGSCAAGKLKRPYVQVDKATYTSPELASQFALIGRPIVLHVHEDDMRTVEAFLEDGTRLGLLTVRERGWRRTKHSRDQRKQINRMRDERELSDIRGGDYVECFLEHLARTAFASAANRPDRVSEDATRLAEAIRTTGASVPRVGMPKPDSANVTPLRPIPKLLNLPKPSWG